MNKRLRISRYFQMWARVRDAGGYVYIVPGGVETLNPFRTGQMTPRRVKA